MKRSEDRVVARREIMQGRVLDDEVPLTHRAVHPGNGVARGTESGLAWSCRLLGIGLSKRPLKNTAVVATRAPLRGLGPDHVLHVLDGLAIPLVVERREMVRRRVPLIVDLAVTARAGLARQKEVRRNRAVHRRVCR